MSAKEVVVAAMKAQGSQFPNAGATLILDELRAAGYVVVELPTVYHKGPNDTDASMLRRAAKNLEGGYHIGGGNLQRAIIKLLRSAADASEAGAE